MRKDPHSDERSSRPNTPAAPAPRGGSTTFACAGCGCSAVAVDPALMRAIGWKILPSDPSAPHRPALCPPCTRKGRAALIAAADRSSLG